MESSVTVCGTDEPFPSLLKNVEKSPFSFLRLTYLLLFSGCDCTGNPLCSCRVSPQPSSSRLLLGCDIPHSLICHLRTGSQFSDYTHTETHAHTRAQMHVHRLTAKWLFIKDRDLRGSNRLRDGNCVSH